MSTRLSDDDIVKEFGWLGGHQESAANVNGMRFESDPPAGPMYEVDRAGNVYRISMYATELLSPDEVSALKVRMSESDRVNLSEMNREDWSGRPRRSST